MKYAELHSCITLFFCSTSLFAQQDMEKTYFQPLQDVFQTELVYPQEKNELQLTIGPGFIGSDDYNQLYIPIETEYGITDMWQIGIEWNSFQKKYFKTDPDISGTGGIEVGTKYSFMSICNRNIHAATGFKLGIPVGNEDDGIKEEPVEYEPFISMALDMPALNRIQIFVYTGVIFTQHKKNDPSGTDEPEGPGLNISGGIFIPFNHVVFTAELTMQSEKWDNFQENEICLTPGIVLLLPGNWETGMGVPIGLNRRSDKIGIIALLTYELDIGKNDH